VSPTRLKRRLRVLAASVDRGTWHVMAGLPYPIRVAGFGFRRPKYLNPGRSLAGTVETVGTDAGRAATRADPGAGACNAVCSAHGSAARTCGSTAASCDARSGACSPQSEL